MNPVDENVFQTPHPLPRPPAPNFPTTPMLFYHPGPTSYASAVASLSTPLTLRMPYNPYQHFVGSAHAPPIYSPSSYAPSGRSWTPVPQILPVQYQFTSNYTPSNYTPQSHR